ncbi:uncharacterized protein TNCV_2218421 [Trichonephila clavipes]|nr:uncharacterized protein TNCV_2218421 [Trichonephila clavipes]
MRKQHKTWGKYYNRKRREFNIKVNDLVLVQTHFMIAAGRRVVEKFMPMFEGPYRVLEVRVYHPRQSDTISSDSQLRHYVKDRGLVMGQVDRTQENPKDLGKPRVRRSIAGPSHQIETRQGKPPTEGSRQGSSGQYDRTRETRTTTSGTNRAVERSPVRSKQATAVRPCLYYLRSRVKQPEGIPEERRSNGIDSIPQNNIRRMSLSMEALDGDPVDRSEKRTKEKIRLYRFFFFSFRTSGRKSYCNAASHGWIFKI